MAEFPDVSVIVQGPISGERGTITKRLLGDLVVALPGAEIILSTWPGGSIAADGTLALCCECEDPGGAIVNGIANNVDRQVVSSRNGIARASRAYAMKLRADLRIADAEALRREVRAAMKVLHVGGEGTPARILVTDVTSINPARHPRYFALCDWVYFGRREDLHELFQTPAFAPHVARLAEATGATVVAPLSAEQWITANYVARKLQALAIHIENGFSDAEAVAQLHEETVPKLFEMRSLRAMGLASTKYPPFFFSRDRMYTSREWAHFRQTGQNRKDPLSQLALLATFSMPRALIGLLPRRLVARLRALVARRIYGASD